MPYLLLVVFIGCTLAFISACLLLFRQNIDLTLRANAVLKTPRPTIRERELSNPLGHRIIKPLFRRIANYTYRWLPSEKEAALSKRIHMAGRPGGFGTRDFMALKFIVAVAVICLMVFLEPVLGLPVHRWVLLGGVTALAGWYFPDLYLHQKIQERKNEVEKTLPDILDLITVSVEAGMSFDGALLKTVDKNKGVLATEFLQVLHECKMGKTRREALRDMADRVEVEDLTTFTGSIIQAEQMGLGIGNVLRIQSEQIRRKRRQRVEEKAMKAPVKMLLPIVLFIFPAIFVVLLGPAVIKLLEAF